MRECQVAASTANRSAGGACFSGWCKVLLVLLVVPKAREPREGLFGQVLLFKLNRLCRVFKSHERQKVVS